MARKPRPARISPIDQAIINAESIRAEIAGEVGDACAEALATMMVVAKDIEIGGHFAAYKNHLRESLIDALAEFVSIDPQNVEVVRRTQDALRHYGQLLEWLATTSEAAIDRRAIVEAQVDSTELRED